MIRVVLADDQALVREGFRLILQVEEDIEVVAEAADGRQTLDQVLRTRPDVVLMDVRMLGVDRIEATRRLVASGSSTRVLVLTTFDFDRYVSEAMRAGASGFLLGRPAGLARRGDPIRRGRGCGARARTDPSAAR